METSGTSKRWGTSTAQPTIRQDADEHFSMNYLPHLCQSWPLRGVTFLAQSDLSSVLAEKVSVAMTGSIGSPIQSDRSEWACHSERACTVGTRDGRKF